MIGILGGMGTQAGLDFCNKLAVLYRGKVDQDYPLFRTASLLQKSRPACVPIPPKIPIIILINLLIFKFKSIINNCV